MFFVIYYLFGKNPESLKRDLLLVNYKYVILSIIFGGLAYISRGIRWLILIDALGYKASKINSISSVSVGYLTNLFIPRAGEISRCASLSQIEKIPINKLFGTILIERVIDFIFLFGLLFFTIILKFNDILNFYNKLQSQQTNIYNNLIAVLVTLLFGITCLYFFKKWLKKSKFYKPIISFIEGLKEGFKSIKNIKHQSVFWLHSFGIWIMYFLMTYICFFSIAETLHLTIGDGLLLLILGGVGMIIPTPGGFGSYHYIVMIGLCVLQIPGSFIQEVPYDKYNPALLFPTVVWFAQSSVAVILGSLSLLILFLSKKKNNVTY